MAQLATTQRWLASAMLLLAAVALIAAYRNSVPPSALCTSSLLTGDGATRIGIPMRLIPAAGANELELHHRFDAPTGTTRSAIYLSHVAPFYTLVLNGRDLTPITNPQHSQPRSRGPQLHAVAADLLRTSGNELTLRLPLRSALGDVRVGQLCVGPWADLHEVWLANWWRQTGIAAASLAILVILGLIATTLALLQRNMSMWRWYLVCVALAAARLWYVLSTTLPINAIAWRALSDLCVLLFIYAMYRLLLQFWSVRAHRWSNLLLGAAIVARAVMTWTDRIGSAGPEMLYWGCVALIAGTLVIEVSVRARHAPLGERVILRWALGFALSCGLVETGSKYLFPLHATIGIYPLGITVLIAMIGFLLARRASAGARLLAQATRVLGQHLDDALPNSPAGGSQAWARVSSELAQEERQHILGVIQQGFGARMLAVLARIQREHPDSPLSTDIHRALLDLRLMIDAVDESCQSLGGALDTLRQRMAGSLTAAGITAHWNVEALADRQIASRRRLAELFRCLEELISNVIQHAQASTLRVEAAIHNGMPMLSVSDDGHGLGPAQRGGRGLRNVELRMQALEGSFTIAAGSDGRGTCARLSWPRL